MIVTQSEATAADSAVEQVALSLTDVAKSFEQGKDRTEALLKISLEARNGRVTGLSSGRTAPARQP